MERISAQDFWQYSLSVYKHDQVKQVCLWVQDELGGNVNMLLFSMFTERVGVYVSKHSMHWLLDQASGIEAKLVLHRAVRRAAKLDFNSDPNEDRLTYDRLLKEELVLEKRQQNVFVEQFKRVMVDGVNRQTMTNQMSQASNLMNYRDILINNANKNMHSEIEQNLSELVDYV